MGCKSQSLGASPESVNTTTVSIYTSFNMPGYFTIYRGGGGSRKLWEGGRKMENRDCLDVF